jgi:hypothetical protein
MEAFVERLARLSELSSDELTALETELIAAFDAADAGGDVGLMQDLADALDQVRAALAAAGEGAPAEAAAPAGEEVVAASAVPEPEIEPETETPETETEAEPESGETESDDDESSNDSDEETTEETETSGDELAELDATTPVSEGEAPSDDTQDNDDPVEEDQVPEITADEVPEENRPDEEALAAAAPVIRVGGDIPGYTAGATLVDFDDAIEAITTKVNSMRGIGGDGEHVMVASIRSEEDVPDSRVLRAGDAAGNSKKIRELISDPANLTPEALVAAGWCAPRAPIYDVPTIGTTARPVRDGIPGFTADRGGVTWMPPPSLAAAVEAMARWTWDSTAGKWQSYAGPSGTTKTATPDLKPCIDIPCGPEQSADLEALTICLCFDNMMTRANPEWVRANTDVTLVAQARFAEQYLLAKLWDSLLSTADGLTIGTPETQLGAARDFLTTVRLTAAQFRWRHRLSPTQPLQILAPAWLRDAIADDLMIQMPGDDTMATSYAEIDSYLSDANVSAIWYLDDVPVGAGGAVAVGADDAFDSYVAFPANAEWLLYTTGSFVRLDGGSLDLGIVRTKDDVQKNKYCEFSETFESVAYMGPAQGATNEGWVIRGRTAVAIRGGFAPAVAMPVVP